MVVSYRRSYVFTTCKILSKSIGFMIKSNGRTWNNCIAYSLLEETNTTCVACPSDCSRKNCAIFTPFTDSEWNSISRKRRSMDMSFAMYSSNFSASLNIVIRGGVGLPLNILFRMSSSWKQNISLSSHITILYISSPLYIT